MKVARRNGLGSMPFAEFARDHTEHGHCAACANCIVDPSPLVRSTAVIWCAGCANRLDAKLPPDVPRPWVWDIRNKPSCPDPTAPARAVLDSISGEEKE